MSRRGPRGFLAADILGVVLLRGDEVPNEGHKIGLQIDDFLRQAKEEDDKLKGAARTAKSKARSKAGGEALEKKLLARDLKLKSDREALWGRVVSLKFPAGKVEAKRERTPAPEPKPEPPPAADIGALIADVEAAAANLKEAKAEVLELTCSVRRVDKSIQRHGEPKVPTCLLKSLDADGPEFFQKSAELEVVKREWQAEWKQYKEACSLQTEMHKDLIDLRRDEADAVLELKSAQVAMQRELARMEEAAVQAHAEVDRRDQNISVLELAIGAIEERDARECNAQKRAQLLADAERVWGPDHASRRPPGRPWTDGYYDLRDNVPPSPPPSPPEPPPSSEPPVQPPPSPPTPPTRPPRCSVCGAFRLPINGSACLQGGACTITWGEDEESETDEQAPVSPVHPQQPLGEPGPSAA